MQYARLEFGLLDPRDDHVCPVHLLRLDGLLSRPVMEKEAITKEEWEWEIYLLTLLGKK